MDEKESAEKYRKERKAAMDTIMEFMITAYIDGVASYEEVEIMANILFDPIIE